MSPLTGCNMPLDFPVIDHVEKLYLFLMLSILWIILLQQTPFPLAKRLGFLVIPQMKRQLHINFKHLCYALFEKSGYKNRVMPENT